MTQKVGRNDRCPCGSNKKYKKCHGQEPTHAARPAVSNQQTPLAGKAITREHLGLPGGSYRLWAQMVRKDEVLDSKFVHRPDRYRVTFTLGRGLPDSQNLSFQKGEHGDSYVAFPASTPGSKDEANEMVVFAAHADANGIPHKIEIRGHRNAANRLARMVVQDIPANSFMDAESVALSHVGPVLSMFAYHADVPMRLVQADVTQLSTGNTCMTYICPFPDMGLGGLEQSNSPYIQSLIALHREATNSNSPNYQFLCWYKILEGINEKRLQDGKATKSAIVKKLPEEFDATAHGQRARFAEVFPALINLKPDNPTHDNIVPAEVRTWKFNRVREKILEPIRNKIAHMLTDASGDLSLSPDSPIGRQELLKWLSLLRFMARVMTANEIAREPQSPQLFPTPAACRHIDEARKQVFG